MSVLALQTLSGVSGMTDLLLSMPGIAALWPLQEAAGASTVTDAKNGHSGSVKTNAALGAVGPTINTQAAQAAQLAGDVLGTIENAYTAEWLTGCIDGGISDDYDTLGDMTVTAWVYPTSFDAPSVFYCLGIANCSNWYAHQGWNFSLRPVTGQIRFWRAGVGSADAPVAYAAPLNSWSHVAAVCSGSERRMYLNGERVSTATIDVPTQLNQTYPMIIGRESSNFAGRIAFVSIAKAAWSDASIKAIWRHAQNSAAVAAKKYLVMGV